MEEERIRPFNGGEALANFPIPLFSSVMGMAGLTLALDTAEVQAGWPSYASRCLLVFTIGIFLTLITLYILKFLRYPYAVAAEWQHPVKLAFFPALSISFLLIAAALRPVSTEVAYLIWSTGALGQIGLTLAVLSNWIGSRPFQPIHLSPAWFIPAVGNVVAPVAGVSLGFDETSWIFFSAGLIFWIILLVLVMNRLVFHDPLPANLVPTLAILIAPPAVAFLAWLQLNGGVLDALARFFYSTAIVFFALALTQVGKLRNLPFALSWWALSFPMAALCIATFYYGTLSNSITHIAAGYMCLLLLIMIVAALIARTGFAIIRGEISQLG